MTDMTTNLNPKKVMKYGPELIEVAENAAEWLLEHREGTQQYEIGQELRRVIEKIKNGS